MKKSMNEMKNRIESIHIRAEQMEDNNLEDMHFEVLQSEEKMRQST